VKGDEDEAKARLAPHLLWWPLVVRGNTVAVLMLGRRAPWTEGDFPLLNVLCGSYAQAWELARARLAPARAGGRRRIKRLAIAAALVLLAGIGLMPVRSSAIAPAEIVARTPAFVRAPFAGVVDAIEVAPNAPVKTGQLIVRLERRQLDAEYKVAAKVLETAIAQYRQASQEAITDPRAREQLATLRARLDEARADFDYRQTRLARRPTALRSSTIPRSGSAGRSRLASASCRCRRRPRRASRSSCRSPKRPASRTAPR
jgi:hypothetical protein